jgi:hypothetical protein
VAALPWRAQLGSAAFDGCQEAARSKAHPFFEHAEAEYFLAWRDGRPLAA